MAEHENLTAALAAVQTQLPVIAKDKTAKVRTKTGPDYSYKYVDLATISAAVLPLLGAAGLAWTTLPTLDEGGRFVLRYQLRHTSGEELAGAYPLPSGGTPQEIGSAITYGRRYCLCSVVGVSPDEDDDGHAASQAQQRPRQRRTETVELPEPPEETGETGETGELVSTSVLQQLGIELARYGLPQHKREERLAYVARVVGREIESSKDLTDAEARHVLSTVRKQIAEDKRAATVEDGGL